MNFFRILLVVLAAVVMSGALAQESADSVSEKLKSVLPPNASLQSIAESAMPGVYIADLGGQMVNVYAAGKHLLIGEAYDVERKVSLLNEARSLRTGEELEKMSVEDMIVFGPEDAKRYITVFTDIDCGYCRKLHREMADLNAGGLQVRYLAFPRAGIGSDSYKKAVSVWCSEDRQQAMTDAKLDRPVTPKNCENPVALQYQAGLRIGVRGTPTLVLDDGAVVPGYIPAAQLLARLGLSQN